MCVACVLTSAIEVAAEVPELARKHLKNLAQPFSYEQSQIVGCPQVLQKSRRRLKEYLLLLEMP